MVSGRLRAKFPGVFFMGEETYRPGARIGPEPTFVVDPIDGPSQAPPSLLILLLLSFCPSFLPWAPAPLTRKRTPRTGTTNFIHSFPNACVSLGLAVDRKPVVGVIYNPWQDLLFTAVSGRGAFMTRVRGTPPLRLPLAGPSPRPLTGLSAALVAVEWGSSRSGPNFDLKTDVFRRLTASADDGGAMCHSLRSLGSAALNLAHVAAGTLDLYWEGGCWAWDVCAGWCVLAEAGGRMVSGNPGNWDPALEERVYLAVRGAPQGQEEIVEEFWSVIGDRKMDYSV